MRSDMDQLSAERFDKGTRSETKMTQLEDVTLAAFAICNGLRIFAYLPQIRAATLDPNGASAISYTTWGLFLLTNIATISYAIVNCQDLWMAACFAGNALCCVSILAITFGKRHKARHRNRHRLMLGTSAHLTQQDQWDRNRRTCEIR